MKNYFNVSFKYSESVYCANIAHAETAADVEAYYSSKYEWVSVSDASDYDVEEASRRGKPIIEVEAPATQEAQQEAAPIDKSLKIRTGTQTGRTM